MEKDIELLLIIPSALDRQGNPVRHKKLLLPSITMPMLAAVTPAGVSITIIYETIEDIPFGKKWDLVGISGMGSGSVRAWQIADAFRENGVKTIIGGIGPSLFDPEMTLRHADCIVIGEAEEIWGEVIEDFRSGRLQRIYRQERASDLSTLPTPRFDLMNMKKMGFMRSVQATRGCPYTCRFCSVSAFYHGAYRKRPVDKVIQDVRAAKKTGSRFVVFLDDNIFFDHEYNRELWTALIPEKIIWISSATIHIADYPAMLELAYKSGCRMLSVGIETLDKQNLKTVHKNWNHPGEYIRAVEILRANHIMVSASIMLGMDHDTKETFNHVFEFLMEGCVPIPRIMIITPIPGTPYFSELEKENRIINHDFSKYTGGIVVFQPKNMNAEELEEGYWKMYSEVFTPKNIFRRMSKNITGQNPMIIAGLFVTNFNYRKQIQKRVVPGIT
ncbi:MAG: radical SAM protein [Bacteroidota bacterium]|jgi:radical SAM superfamily enzyme YgiQ (UPF0313 family)